MNDKRQAIDWDEVRSRLEVSRLALEKALSGDPARTDESYRKRALELASRRAQIGAPSSALRVLVFALGTDRYGLELNDLVELMPMTNCVPVPGGPAQLLGVTNIHGEVRSVVDLALLLELPGSEDSASGYLLLVRREARKICLRVDRLDRIQLIAPEELGAPAGVEAGASFRYLQGLSPDKIRLLSTDAILAHPVFQWASS